MDLKYSQTIAANNEEACNQQPQMLHQDNEAEQQGPFPDPQNNIFKTTCSV